MTAPLPEPPTPKTFHEPAEVERKNVLFGLALFAFVVLLFAGTIGVAFLYLALD
jgi:hypothetical protein